MAEINVAFLDSSNTVTNIARYDEDYELQEGQVRAYCGLYVGQTYYPSEDVQRIADENEMNSAIEEDKLQKEVKAERNKLLAATDFMMMSDYPITSDKKTELETYRQALRDITTHDDYPNLTADSWPTFTWNEHEDLVYDTDPDPDPEE